MAEAKSEKASDEKYAKDLKMTCSKKAMAFDERQKLRKEESPVERILEVFVGILTTMNRSKYDTSPFSIPHAPSVCPHLFLPINFQELEALSKAQDIISSGAVAGSAEKHLPSLLQRKSSLAFLRSWAQRPAELEQAKSYVIVEWWRLGGWDGGFFF